MNDRDCESCKKFSCDAPTDYMGYCEAKHTYVVPEEDCKMHEFTLHSATKYKDGTPIMSEPKVDTDSSYPQCKAEKNSMYGKVAEGSNQLDPDYCKFGTCPYYDKFCDHTLQDKHGCAHLPHDTAADIKYLEQTFTEFAKTQDELIEEYDATLKTHGDTLEDHMERITINEGNIDAISSEVEDLQRKVAAFYQFINTAAPGTFFKILEELKKVEKENVHNGSDFCGNCVHCDHGKQGDDTVYICTLLHGFVDPDDSSCAHFEPPF